MKLNFKQSRLFTLGAELELQIIDRESFALSSSSPQILALANDPKGIVAEFYQSMIEIKTGVYLNANDAGMDLQTKVQKVQDICEPLGLKLISAGMHPWSCFTEASIFPNDRYRQVLESKRWIARKMLVCGLHAHIGMESGDQAMRISRAFEEYLPILLAFSSSSPFSEGLDTGLSSVRSTVFESIPTGGLPESFGDWAEFESVYSKLLSTGVIESAKDLWWDIRPCPSFGTLEIRVCDAPSTIREATALIALVHLICFKSEREFARGERRPPIPRGLLRENKWRALRDGVRAEIISNSGDQAESVALAFAKLVDETGPWIKLFGYEAHIETLYRILKHGSSSDRQRRNFRKSAGDLRAVISSLVEDLETDRPVWVDTSKASLERMKSKKGENECA